MGKGQRSRIARADEMAAKKAAAKKKERQNKITRVITIVTAIVLVVAVAGMIIYTTVNSNNRNNGTYLKKDIAVESTSYSFNNAQQMYFFQNYYSSFVNQYSDYLSYFGLDTDTSLKEQTSPYTDDDGNTMSWYEYFMQATIDQVEQSVILAEAALEAGLSLSEDEQADIENTLSQITPENFAPGLTEDEVRECLEMTLLASNYSAQITEGIEYTDADIEQYYSANKNDYDMVNYRMYSFSYADESDEEEDSDAISKEDAKKLADSLAATEGDETAYVAWLSNYFTNTLGIEADSLQTELDATYTEGYTYSEGYTGIEFLFGDAKAGDIEVIDDEDSTCYKVFMMITPAYRDETVTKSVRHILIGVDDVEDTEAMATAKAEAEALLEQWKTGEATESSFAALVADNTDDSGSAETGGLYENFAKGEMVESFENWAYDEARVVGDTGIVESDYGYHIMYFVGNGDITWKLSAAENYVSDKYSEQYTALAEKYTVTVNDDKIANIASYIS